MSDTTHRKLRGLIIEKYSTLSNFADSAELTLTTVSRLVAGKAKFSAEVIRKWVDLLDIDKADIADYFLDIV